jgi:proline iminopeptidase
MKYFYVSGILIFLMMTDLRSYAQTEGIIQNKNSKIFYRTYGKGIPLLIINGGPGMNSDGFIALAKELSQKNQTIIYDQRGTGRSTVSPVTSSTITMDQMVEDLEVLRTHLNIEKWTILGHSFGGMLAAYYTVKHPGHVRSLIFSSSGGIDLELESYVEKSINGKLSPAEKDSLKYWNMKITAGDTSHFARFRRGMALAPAYVYNKKFVPVIAERLTQGNAMITGLVWQDLDKIKFNCKPELLHFNKPVLIIQGKEDIISFSIGEKAHKVLKNSKLVLVDNCVHYGWLDNPEEYFREINAFLLLG